MRRHRSTCAPVRAALVQLRVANGVKRGRGREEVEAPERRKRRLSVPRSLESVGGGGCWQAQRGELPSVPRTAGGRECGAREGGSCGSQVPARPPRRPGPRGAPGAPGAAEKRRRNADGPGGCLAGAQRPRRPGAPSALRSLTSGKGQGTVNQRGRERTGAG